ncbi:hypothetical protein T459_35382 [Capsicum annuum]|uniref:Uncharacterized protein n=1 Tax=Capsicum annuum TaxID=4072 RepID=A0A2G2XTD4_CAPAN|nr:hypothetical protein T459_35382 [Capsicum annuum]
MHYFWRIRAEKYFNELSKFLSSKLSKVDFDKSCIRTIGRENIHLHNHLLLSKPLHSGSVYNFSLETCQSCGELPESRFLRSHLEWKLQSEGLGISSDCANLLNNSLDAFLKRLIEPCIELAGSRHTNERFRYRNGQILPGWYGQFPRNYTKRQTRSSCASMLDFRVVVETNPCILGEIGPPYLKRSTLLLLPLPLLLNKQCFVVNLVPDG